MNRKILIHCHVFSPDGVSSAYLYSDIALKFKEAGFEVSVLTTTPHYNVIEPERKKQPLKKKMLGLYYESNFNGIKVKHVYQKKYKSTALRLLGFVYWHLVSFFIGLFEKKVDVILSPSPPLTIGVINILLGKIKGAKVIYNVQEIYPDLLIEKGGLKSKIVISLLKGMERFVYNHSDAVTTIDEIFYNTIAGRLKVPAKLHIIPNFVDTSIYRPIEEELDLDPDSFPVGTSLKLMYAGNIGLAQDWDPLIKLAEELKAEDIEFFVIGEGVMKDFLKKEIEQRKLNKIHLIPYQARELMPHLLAYSDIQFIFMAPETERDGFPSKVYTIMACARPLLVCSGENTPIVNFLKDKDCAYLFTEKDTLGKVRKMVDLLKEVPIDDIRKKGNNGFGHIENSYTKDIVTKKYIDLINSVLEDAPSYK